MWWSLIRRRDALLREDGYIVINGPVLEAKDEPRRDVSAIYGLRRLPGGDNGHTIKSPKGDEAMAGTLDVADRNRLRRQTRHW